MECGECLHTAKACLFLSGVWLVVEECRWSVVNPRSCVHTSILSVPELLSFTLICGSHR